MQAFRQLTVSQMLAFFYKVKSLLIYEITQIAVKFYSHTLRAPSPITTSYTFGLRLYWAR